MKSKFNLFYPETLLFMWGICIGSFGNQLLNALNTKPIDKATVIANTVLLMLGVYGATKARQKIEALRTTLDFTIKYMMDNNLVAAATKEDLQDSIQDASTTDKVVIAIETPAAPTKGSCPPHYWEYGPEGKMACKYCRISPQA